MTRTASGGPGSRRRAIVAATLCLCATGAAVGTFADWARAGQWMRVSCVNPDGSAAGNEGWSGFFTGTPEFGSDNSPSCAPGTPMFATLTTVGPAPVGTSENLRYTPPATSTLVGGNVTVDLFADALSFNASGTATLFTPSFVADGSNVFFLCAAGLGPCATPSPNDFSGTVPLPGNRGGELFVGAGCGGDPAAQCDAGGSFGAWSFVRVYSANLMLANDSTPTATAFAGSLLSPGAHGTATLTFTTTDPSGPGIYKVTVQIDAKTVYDATPNTNAGKCAPVSTEPVSGALMFDSQQPCPQTASVAAQIPTGGLRDGQHDLRITVSDAAQNTATVFAQTITTANRTTVSALLGGPRPPALAGPAIAYAAVLDPITTSLERGVKRTYRRSALTLSGTLHTLAGAPAPGVTMSLLASVGGAAGQTVAQTISDASGQWKLVAPMGLSRLLQVVYGDPAQATAATSLASVTEDVSPGLTLQIKSHHGVLRFSGRMTPGQITPRPALVVEVKRGRSVQSVGLPIYAHANGTYRSKLYHAGQAAAGQAFVFRVVTVARSGAYRSAHSAWRRVVVH